MLYLLLYILFFLSLAYALFLAWIALQWQRGKRQAAADPPVALPTISVLIPARNEAKNIRACVQSVLDQEYPRDRFEIIVINDQSTDATERIVADLTDARIRLLTTETPGKKAALQLGIAHARGELIVTTDADVVAPRTWLKTIIAAYQVGIRMILAPVKMTGPSGWLTAWQGLDVCGTMLLTGAAVQVGHPLLANGANLAFAKTSFLRWGGYAGNAQRASGDDIFLLQKAVREDPRQVAYVFSPAALVSTRAEESWGSLLRQRLRWAGKTGAYRDGRLVIFQACVYALCVGLIVGAGALLWWPEYFPWVAAAWAIKLIAEYVYLHYACRETGDPAWLKWLPLTQLTHPFYITIIGTLALLPIRVRWKGRVSG